MLEVIFNPRTDTMRRIDAHWVADGDCAAYKRYTYNFAREGYGNMFRASTGGLMTGLHQLSDEELKVCMLQQPLIADIVADLLVMRERQCRV